MKRAIFALLMVPIALCVAYAAINFGTSIINGDVSLMGWIGDHKFILAFVACYIGLQFFGPFKK